MHAYNATMNAVDQFDQNIARYNFNRKTVKWWKRALTRLLHVAKVQCMILYNKTHEDEQLTTVWVHCGIGETTDGWHPLFSTTLSPPSITSQNERPPLSLQYSPNRVEEEPNTKLQSAQPWRRGELHTRCHAAEWRLFPWPAEQVRWGGSQSRPCSVRRLGSPGWCRGVLCRWGGGRPTPLFVRLHSIRFPNNVSNDALSDPAPDACPAVVEGNGETRLICEEDSGQLLPGPVQMAPSPHCRARQCGRVNGFLTAALLECSPASWRRLWIVDGLTFTWTTLISWRLSVVEAIDRSRSVERYRKWSSCVLVQRGCPEGGCYVTLPVARNRPCSRWMTEWLTCRRLATSVMDTASPSHARARPQARMPSLRLDGKITQSQIPTNSITTQSESNIRSATII